MREYARGERDATEEVDDWYGGGREQVRTAIMDLTGHFPTESSHHNSEYLPFFRRTPAETLSYIANRWDYLEQCRETHGSEELQQLADELTTGELETSEEYAAQIVDSIITGTPRVIYGNVPNTGLITNLPDGCCVEVACLVDSQRRAADLLRRPAGARAPASTSARSPSRPAWSRRTARAAATPCTPRSASTG